MKLNVNVRFRNVWFWIGIGATILAAMGVEPETFVSWPLVWQAIVDLVKNPFQLGCVILAVLGVVIDPTTKGVSDSERALTYKTPN